MCKTCQKLKNGPVILDGCDRKQGEKRVTVMAQLRKTERGAEIFLKGMVNEMFFALPIEVRNCPMCGEALK